MKLSNKWSAQTQKRSGTWEKSTGTIAKYRTDGQVWNVAVSVTPAPHIPGWNDEQPIQWLHIPDEYLATVLQMFPQGSKITVVYTRDLTVKIISNERKSIDCPLVGEKS